MTLVPTVCPFCTEGVRSWEASEVCLRVDLLVTATGALRADRQHGTCRSEWLSVTRLETRTKESRAYASIVVIETRPLSVLPKCGFNEKAAFSGCRAVTYFALAVAQQ